MREHGVSNQPTPRATSRDDGCQRDRAFAFQRVSNSLRYLKHRWPFCAGGDVPGLHKHVEDAAAHTLALHGNLFGEIDLHHSWTMGINDVERGAPHVCFAAAAANGAADGATALHQHLRYNLAWNRAFAPDDGGNGNRLSCFQVLDEFFIQILHIIGPLVLPFTAFTLY